MRSFTVLVEQDEDGWFISEVLELPGCHTQAKTLDELLKRTKEAITLYLEACYKRKVYSDTTDGFRSKTNFPLNIEGVLVKGIGVKV